MTPRVAHFAAEGTLWDRSNEAWHAHRIELPSARIDAVRNVGKRFALMARYTYRARPAEAGFIARCVEMSVEAEAPSLQEAVALLRAAIEEKRSETNAVAPPPPESLEPIELVRVEPEEPERSPQGPGEVAPRS
ncbi:MAG: hypothetical protein IPK60_16335 [Sandaracinaceae bacterium]|nr:hypothetical protein [Sandaracinaceae bacterium]